MGLGQQVALIGYGSLMSGTGLLRSGRLRVKNAHRVSLDNCRRGFAKYAQRGDRYALDIEFVDRSMPILGTIATRGTERRQGVEGLVFWVRGIDLEGIMEREGYSAAAFHNLARLSREGKSPLGRFLWDMYEHAGFNLVSYRQQLCARIGYTSPHYILHPVPLGNNNYGILFLAPAYQATGSARVISVRERTRTPHLMSLVEAWRRKPNAGQTEYFISCLLGGVHGINVRDLLADLRSDETLPEIIHEQLTVQAPHEIARFLQATQLAPKTYVDNFGTPEENLDRGGLRDLMTLPVPSESKGVTPNPTPQDSEDESGRVGALAVSQLFPSARQ